MGLTLPKVPPKPLSGFEGFRPFTRWTTMRSGGISHPCTRMLDRFALAIAVVFMIIRPIVIVRAVLVVNFDVTSAPFDFGFQPAF